MLAIIIDEKGYNYMLRKEKRLGVNHEPILVIRVSSDVLGRRRLTSGAVTTV